MNQEVTSIEKHVLAEYELDELIKKSAAISTKGLTEDLINKYKILNGPKCCSLAIL